MTEKEFRELVKKDFDLTFRVEEDKAGYAIAWARKGEEKEVLAAKLYGLDYGDSISYGKWAFVYKGWAFQREEMEGEWTMLPDGLLGWRWEGEEKPFTWVTKEGEPRGKEEKEGELNQTAQKNET